MNDGFWTDFDRYSDLYNSLSDKLSNAGIDTKELLELIEAYDKIVEHA